MSTGSGIMRVLVRADSVLFGERVITPVSATLKVTHKAVGAEVRRDSYDLYVDGNRAGTVAMNQTIEIALEPGTHTVQVRDGRKSSGERAFDVAEGTTISFRCTGKRFLPIFLASFIFPKLALKLVRD